MTRTPLILLMLMSCISGFSQDVFLRGGQVKDVVSGQGIPGAHIINKTDLAAAISDLTGIFRIPVKLGDTLLITTIGFSDRVIPVTDSIITVRPFYVRMVPKIYELGEVRVNPLGSKSQFQNDFMNLELADEEHHILGIKKVKPQDHPIWEDANEIKKAKYALNPISFLYYNTNRHAKARQEYRRLMKNDRVIQEARKKFDRSLVADMTRISADSIDAFMAYCAFSDHFLIRSSQYEVVELMLTKLSQFRKENANNSSGSGVKP